jgi:hypothetical protein
MKFLFLALLSFSLFAEPKVGDFSEYDLLIKQNGQTITGSFTQEITYISGDTIEVLSSSNIMGSVSSENVQYKVEDFLDAQEGADILTYCQYLGVIEQFTVAGQSYPVCKMVTDANGEPATTWIGAFPFAVAKYQGFEQGADVTTTLKSFKFGY